MTTIRLATEQDLPAILEIYNDAILTTTATFDLEPKTLEEREAWLASRKPEHPVVVAEDAGTILGWASLSPWSDRAGYRITAEPSLYVHRDHRGKGLGRALLQWAVDEARRQGFHSLISRIDSANQLSVDLHLRFGFTEVGRLREVGTKFGGMLDVVLLQKLNP